jgi:modification methylase
MKVTPEKRKQKLEDEKKLREKYQEMFWNTEHKIIFKDSKKMKDIKKNSTHLVITSPPYYNAKKYSQWENLDDYLKDMKKTFKECFRILKPGRKFCLNISDLPEKGESGVRWIPLGSELIKLCQQIGFEIVDRIFWFKTPLKGFQYGSLPFPPSPLINDSVEYIYILRKPGKSDYSYLDKDMRNASKLNREEYGEFTKQIWSMRRVRLNENVEGHIAPFPLELPSRCIQLYSFVGDIVVDPFGGRGTTTKAALDNRRNSIIYEIRKEYLPLINKMLDTNQTKLMGNSKIEIINEK